MNFTALSEAASCYIPYGYVIWTQYDKFRECYISSDNDPQFDSRNQVRGPFVIQTVNTMRDKLSIMPDPGVFK